MSSDDLQGFPKITNSARTGVTGVGLVSQVVNDQLSCIFRENHNEHDFGVDGYIDLVSNSNHVTGRCIAVQIKCGTSFFLHSNEDGYVYYGEKKHLNYLLNHPIPIIIIICDPIKRKCFWEMFDASITEPTPTGWKMTIPKEKAFCIDSRQELEKIAGPVEDKMGS